MTEQVDAVVVGTGPGGEDIAIRLAEADLNVVAVERRLIGGECPYYACIPTKMMLRASEVLAEGRKVPDLAGQAKVFPDWLPVADRIREEATTGWDDEAALRRLETAGVRLVRGTGRLAARDQVTVSGPDGEQTFRARRAIVLNPGTEPLVPPIEGLSGTPYWTNRDAVTATRAPRSLLVIGGGPVGLEFAQAFARFNTAVTVVESQPRPLPAGEPEASQAISAALREEGVGLHLGRSVARVEHDGTHFHARLDNGQVLNVERVLVASGRRTDLGALQVGAAGLDENARTIPVDERMRAAPGIWAIGDVTGHGAYTHVSVYQSRIAAADILGREAEVASYRAVPSVVFTQPEVASVGLTEQQARERQLNVRTALTDITTGARGWIHQATQGIIKLVADADREVLIGATVVSPAGGEVLSMLTLAVHAEIPVRTLREMIYAYPTFHRSVVTALAALHI